MLPPGNMPRVRCATQGLGRTPPWDPRVSRKVRDVVALRHQEVPILRRNVFIGVGLLLVGLVAGIGIAPVVRATTQPAFSESFPLLQEIYQTITQNYYTPVDNSKLVQGAINGMTGALNDPYTVYYTPSEYQQFTQQVNGQYAGIGAELDQVAQGVEVMTVFPGTPAAKAGVQTGDIFIKVNGKSTSGWSADAVANAVRGDAGTKVTIEFQRMTRDYTVTLTRALITIPTATAKMLPHGIGLITLSQFSQNAASAFQSALQRLQQYHPKAYILDMRNNPGGYVDQAVGIAQDIIPQGKVATLVGKNYPAQAYSSQSGKSLGVPLVVLVNGGTASAAEILSAAIVQNHEGRLMGTQTFGKGIAQQVMPMQDGGYLKITIAQWMTPNGSNIEHKGITPSYIVTGSQAPLAAAQASLGGLTSMQATVSVGSRWLTAAGQQDPLGHAPVLQGGQLYLSETAIEQATGALVNYVQNAKTFELTLGKDTLVLPLGSTRGTLDGRSLRVTPAQEISGAPMIPLQDLEQSFHVKSLSLGNGSYRLTTTY